MVKFQIGKRQSQVSGTVVGRELNGLIEISGGLLSVVEIVQHVSAIYIGLHHFRVSLHGTGEVVGGLLQQPVLLVHIAIQQRNVGFLRQDRFILGGEAQQFVITAKVVQVIAEIDGRIAVFGEQLDHLAS